MRLFVIGAGLGIGGMVLDSRWIVGAGMVALALGFLLRFLPGGKGVSAADGEPGFDDLRAPDAADPDPASDEGESDRSG